MQVKLEDLQCSVQIKKKKILKILPQVQHFKLGQARQGVRHCCTTIRTKIVSPAALVSCGDEIKKKAVRTALGTLLKNLPQVQTLELR